VADQKPGGARPVYRYMAGGVAAFCFVAAAVYGLVPGWGADRTVGVVVFLFIGFMMTTVAATGYWPANRKR
jgi:hypothetical protein